MINHAEDLDLVMPMYNLIEYNKIIQIHQEAYGSLKGIKFQLIMLI